MIRAQATVRIADHSRVSKAVLEAWTAETAQQVALIARRNVRPGVGPGPHPHITPHEDTGNLERSIRVESKEGSRHKALRIICSDVDYGVYLEYGWTNPWTGNFWRYPWLAPAMAEARATGSLQRFAMQWNRAHGKISLGKPAAGGEIFAYGKGLVRQVGKILGRGTGSPPPGRKRDNL